MQEQCGAAKRGLVAICLASLCWAFSFGAGAPLAALWLRDQGYTPTAIGVNSGVYYLGIVLAAGFVPWLMHYFRRGCPFLGMLLSSATVILFPYGGDLA